MIVVDTHAWMWWTAERHKLSRVAFDAITNTNTLAISAITLWEIAMWSRRNGSGLIAMY